jgi:hypothetical protein
MFKVSIGIVCFLFVVTLFSCHKVKFNSTRWQQYLETDGPDGSEREAMAEDLLQNYKLVGLTNKQMLQLLGPPANQTDTTKTYYTLSEKYDLIDPVSGKDLIIKFNKDSIITSAEIKEWHKH